MPFWAAQQFCAVHHGFVISCFSAVSAKRRDFCFPLFPGRPKRALLASFL
jgi:hypothetical protein